MVKFLSNDFTQPGWQAAAIKNAYSLLGKQRYELAAAFFLLGERLEDSIRVCIQFINDSSLAILVARLFEPGKESFRKLLASQVELIDPDDHFRQFVLNYLLNGRQHAALALYKTKKPETDPVAYLLYKEATVLLEGMPEPSTERLHLALQDAGMTFIEL